MPWRGWGAGMSVGSSLAKGRMGKTLEQWCLSILERLRIVSLGERAAGAKVGGESAACSREGSQQF